jgi:hypothetical protein
VHIYSVVNRVPCSAHIALLNHTILHVLFVYSCREWVFNGVISTYCRDALLKNGSAQLPTDSDQTAINATTKRTTYAALLASIPRLRSLLENPTMCAQLMLHTSKPALSFIAGKLSFLYYSHLLIACMTFKNTLLAALSTCL